jgi:ABC-type nitrate/sulfonate/bicarbonate transport system substrate-binding protein
MSHAHSSPTPTPPDFLRHPDYSEGFVNGYLDGIEDALLHPVEAQAFANALDAQLVPHVQQTIAQMYKEAEEQRFAQLRQESLQQAIARRT